MKPALAQVCTLNSSFEQDIDDYAAGKCSAIEIWLGKLEQYLKFHTVDDVRRLLDEHEVQCPVASFQGGLLSSQGDFRRESWELFTARLPILEQLGVTTLVVAGDVWGELSQTLLERVQVSLRQAGDLASQHNVRVAVEFQAQAVLGNNLQTMAWLIEQAAAPNVGLCFDIFHYYLGPSKAEDLVYLTSDNLFHVQLSDLVGQARELATDGERILPGDGDFFIGPLVDRLRQIQYEGYVSIELLNPQMWHVPPRSFSEIAMTALRKLLGQASMS